MRTISRRHFAGLLVSAPLMPVFSDSLAAPADVRPPGGPPFPRVLAGHTLTEEEEQLARAFLEGHEQSMAPLRQRVLPNDLAPFEFAHFIQQPKAKR